MPAPTSSLFLAVLLSLALNIAAQPAAEARGDGPSQTYALISVANAPTGSIAGKVVNDPGTGDVPEGVSGVRVFVRPANDRNGVNLKYSLSSVAGHFNFDGLAVGPYLVTIDPISIPTRFRMGNSYEWTVDVKAQAPAAIDIPVIAERSISGTVFVDKDRNGEYRPGKDEPVAGALITVGGAFAITKADGTYSFRDLPAGRLAVLVEWPDSAERTHVLLHLPGGPVKNRVVNIAR